MTDGERAPGVSVPFVRGALTPGLGAPGEDRVRCLLVGVILGQQTFKLYDGLIEFEAPHSNPEVGDMLRQTWLRAVEGDREKIAELVPQAVACGAAREGPLARVWETANRSLQQMVSTPEDDKVRQRAFFDTLELIHTLQRGAAAVGIDPPLTRNIRRYERATRGGEERG